MCGVYDTRITRSSVTKHVSMVLVLLAWSCLLSARLEKVNFDRPEKKSYHLLFLLA